MPKPEAPKLTEEDFRRLFPNASPAVLRLNFASGKQDIRTPITDSGETRRLRQQTAPKLNKTEAAFLEWLHQHYDPAAIRAQAITLLIGNGVRYTPDFTNLREGIAWEVKGFMRDDASVKIKVAASAYPELRFFLASRKGGAWEIQSVLP